VYEHPGDQQTAGPVRLKGAQETVLTVAVDVTKVLVLHVTAVLLWLTIQISGGCKAGAGVFGYAID